MVCAAKTASLIVKLKPFSSKKERTSLIALTNLEFRKDVSYT